MTDTRAHHEHICDGCGQTTIHHIFEHENEGDDVYFWCKHCEKDRTGTIGDFFGRY